MCDIISMDKKKAKTRKRSTIKKATHQRAKKRDFTLDELQAKIATFGIGALTPSELVVAEKLDRLKARRKRTDLTLDELEALAKSGKITTAQIKELSEMRQALEKKNWTPPCVQFCPFARDLRRSKAISSMP
jgi:hypothetical protein